MRAGKSTERSAVTWSEDRRNLMELNQEHVVLTNNKKECF